MSRYCTDSRHQSQYGSTTFKTISPKQVADNISPETVVVICCEADEQWSYVRYKGNPRWLFYAHDRIRKRALAHAFGLRNASTLRRLLALLSQFNIAFYMTDAWPVYKVLLSEQVTW
ncbi:MAG: hypothetical protein RL248_2080 [Pseudomonadota bacterium]|jgi:insertion element IS1 protein InsB